MSQPGHQEESGMDNFLETAGTIIAGALASGAAQNLLGGITGSGGQAVSVIFLLLHTRFLCFYLHELFYTDETFLTDNNQ